MALTETDIKIIIAAELKKQGFDKAQKATSGLEKTFKSLGRTIGITFSAAALVNFGKQSIKAFSDDEKAASKLTQTLKNMGLAFEDPRVKAFISSLEATSGVSDDQLRPAMQSLLTTTGSVTKAQELLKLALDVSAGSGEDVASVATDLSKAYVGNTKNLSKYNLGLTKAELSAKSFEEIQGLIATQFSGQNAAYLETYAGQVSVLNIAYDNLQETVGKSLVDAFILLAGDTGVGGATTALANFGQEVADTITGVSLLIDKIKSIPGASLLSNFNMSNFGILGVLQALGEQERLKPKPFRIPMTISGSTDAQTKIDQARAKREKEAADREKKLAALIAKQAKAQAELNRKKKEQALLSEAAKKFDLERIQIEAALKGKISEEERIRLLLQKAILEENAAQAVKLQKDLEAAQANQKVLAESLKTFVANDPFTFWTNYWATQQKERNSLDTSIKSIEGEDPFTVYPAAFNSQQQATSALDAKLKAIDAADPFTKYPAAFQAQQTATKDLSTKLEDLQAADPFEHWEDLFAKQSERVKNLMDAFADLDAAKNQALSIATSTAAAATPTTAAGDQTLGALALTEDQAQQMRDAINALLTNSPNFNIGLGDLSGMNMGAIGGTDVVINVAGSVVSDNDLANKILQIFYNLQQGGTQVTIDTNKIP